MDGLARAFCILIIDDSPTIRGLVKTILKLPDYQVIEAANAEEGRQRLKQYEVDLVLLDIQMPNESGLEMLSSLRAQKAYKSLPIIILTANDGVPDMINALSAGATDYIAKPFDPIKLKVRVRSYVDYKRLMDDYTDLRNVFLTVLKQFYQDPKGQGGKS